MNSLMRKKRIRNLLIGPALFALLAALPLPGFSLAARVSVATVLWMGFWWITLPVGAAVTALLPICINAFFRVIPMDKITSCYFAETVILIFGAYLVTASWEETGLDKRLAMKALCIIGPSVASQVLVWFLLSTVLAMFLPKAVVCAVLVPIAATMLKFTLDRAIEESSVGQIILAAIAWGTGVGGIGTPLGGAMNLVAVDAFEQLTGREFMYTDWVIRMFPMLIAVALLDIVFLFLYRPKKEKLTGSKEYFKRVYSELPPLSRDEIWSLVLFLTATVLAFTRSLYADLLPGFKPAYAFLLCGVLTFFVPKKNGEPLLTWKLAEKKVGWSLLFLFAGGLAAGNMIQDSGAAEAIAALITSGNLNGGFSTVLVIVVFTTVLSEISSNTAAAAIAVPIIISIAEGLGLNPVPYVFISIAAFNVAHMLPTSVRAIPVGHGLRPEYLFKHGAFLYIANVLLISLLGTLMLPLFTL